MHRFDANDANATNPLEIANALGMNDSISLGFEGLTITNSALNIGPIDLNNSKAALTVANNISFDSITSNANCLNTIIGNSKVTFGQDQNNSNSFNELGSITLLDNSTITLNNSIALKTGIYSENNNGHIIIRSGSITIKGQIGSELSHIGSMIIGSNNSTATVSFSSSTKHYINDIKIYSGSSLNLVEGSELIGETHNILNDDYHSAVLSGQDSNYDFAE